ncbi:TraB/GumN family protein [Flavobacterium supellecticarium]|uniref:TraB/GumN family protein n=1 Tax=Flavobacterium supellecticarium TaxID=2565924 RepID=A0A4S3ZSZ8_9FLAO|nr:TraB/GumN family protein [Flavobacterium supellecticarium]THF48809.1 TraB/GumN family protein [Flavobacterium supellecticarium]
MRKIIFLLFAIFFSGILTAQNNKSLLWEISGNGLSKNSYLYGTMHLSDKISYHLSDNFFTHLLAADMVGNESDPETWNDAYELLTNTTISIQDRFYSGFYMFPVKKQDLQNIFTSHNYFNSLLSRTDNKKADYQENTYLDMFIYQTGRKHKKKVVGLEDTKTSFLSLSQIKTDNFVPKEEHRLALYKLLKNRSLADAISEYYREKDVEMLDSLYRMIFPQKAYEALISNRNTIMTKSIDSLVHKGSLFSAVGAAHLGGKKGIISMLREKGYQVTPVFGSFTDVGKNKKEAIENFFMAPKYKMSGTSDSMVQLPLTPNILENDNNLGAPDFTNGGVISIKRQALNLFLKKDPAVFNPKTIDSLFFENIPGKILEKKYFQKDSISGYDIKNITKTGQNQRHRFYITPLEIITVSMTGPGKYVRQYENEVFPNIKIKTVHQNWEKSSPAKGGFSVMLPVFNSIYGNSPEKINDIQIQAYDPATKAYYFVTEKTLHDYRLENSEYEQKQIHYEFYLQQHIDSLSTHYDQTRQSFESRSKIGDRDIRLKTYISGQKYYLLGSVNATEKDNRRFFDSFQKEPFRYNTTNKVYTDSLYSFQVTIPKKHNGTLFYKPDTEKSNEKNAFLSKSENYSLKSDSGKIVDLLYYQFHKYESEIGLDSIRTRFRDFFLNRYNTDDALNVDYDFDLHIRSKNSLLNPLLYSRKGLQPSLWNEIMKDKGDTYTLLKETEQYDKEKKIRVFEALSSKDNSTQAIKYKAVFMEHGYYLLRALVQKDYHNDDSFIEKTFQSFNPLPYKAETSIFDNKLERFSTDALSTNDTIRYSALNSVDQLKITDRDFQTLKDFLNHFEFRDSETSALIELLNKIGALENNSSINLLETFYKKPDTKTSVQLAILNVLAQRKSKAGYKKILELLDYDLPLSDNEDDISTLFYYFNLDLNGSKILFPELFRYYTIKEYSTPVLSLYNNMLDEGLIQPGKMKNYHNNIAANAKLEYKRLLSWIEKNKEVEDEADYETEAPSENLILHINSIYHSQNNKNTLQLLQKIKALNLTEVDIELARLDAINNRLNSKQTDDLLQNPKTNFVTLQLLANKKDFSFSDRFTDEEIATSALLNLESLTENDSLSLLEKRVIENNGKKISYYFYQLIKAKKDDENTSRQLLPIAFIHNGERINVQAYRIFEKTEIIDTEKLPSQYKTIIEQSLNENHFRASFRKVEDNTTSFYQEY